MATILGPKNKKTFECKDCDYKTSKKSQYERHLSTLKHKRTQITDCLGPKKYVCHCGKEYSYRGSLHKHSKNCKKDFTQDLILKLIEENQEMKTCLLKENQELKQQLDQQNKHIRELIPKVGNHYKQEFNINVFLNEKCKNAISINQFIENIEVTLNNLLITKNKGNAIGISKIIMDNMKKLSLYERPLQCMDIKNEILYIKDKEWIKDDNNNKLKQLLKQVELKQIKHIKAWIDEHPNYKDIPSEQIEFTNIIRNCENKKKDEVKIKKMLCSKLSFKKKIEIK